MEPIRSTRNPRVVEASRLQRVRERRRQQATLLEGPHVLDDALRAGAAVRHVFALAEDQATAALAMAAGVELIVVTDAVLARLAPTEHPRGPVAVVDIPPPGAVAGDALWLEVTDPGNAGTLIRTAAAFGFAVAGPAGAVDLWSPKVIRAGAGGHYRTTIAQPCDPSGLPGLRVATVVQGGRPVDVLRDLPADRACLVMVGSEAHGVSDELLDGADIRVTIPMPGGTESLNAAVSGAIVMYELSLRRMSSGDLGEPD